MPLYEYVAEQDGTVIELLRPASQADAPVDDPDGKRRTFVRKLSAFAMSGAVSGTRPGGPASTPAGGCCPCGKNRGACSSKPG